MAPSEFAKRARAAKQPGAPKAGATRRVLVAADMAKDGVRECERELVPWLRERVADVELVDDISAFVTRRAALSRAAAEAHLPDLVVVLGGDGAILGAVRAFAEAPRPTMGINFGRVGFLASTPESDWREALGGVLAGEGILEPRMRLEAEIVSSNGDRTHAIALNEVLVARGAPPGMLSLAVSVDGDWVADYRADGLILATPSGSTAHSLSAGGPILFPSMLGLIVTPVCPQGLSYRPIVLHPDSRIELRVKEATGETLVAVDGQAFHPLRDDDTVRVRRHPVAYPLLAWAKLDPYRRLRDRLGWNQTRYRGEIDRD
jgi:NAD+ kinase